MSTPLSEKQKFYYLLAEVCETLPIGCVDKAVRSGYPQSSVRLSGVRQGRILSLPDLCALIQYGIPKYQIPVHLLPAT